MTRRGVHVGRACGWEYVPLTFDIIRRKRSLRRQASNGFIRSRERRHANDMLMLAARGINGGTPVGRTGGA